MQLSTILTLASVTLSAMLGVSAVPGQVSTEWIPTATVTAVNTYTATRVDQIFTTVSPYYWLTTYPITFTATDTSTLYESVVVEVPEKRSHPRELRMA